MQLAVYHQPAHIVTMAGYENFLALFSHTSHPVFEQQMIGYQLIDCSAPLNGGARQFKTVH